jgi:hypothetical protein
MANRMAIRQIRLWKINLVPVAQRLDPNQSV